MDSNHYDNRLVLVYIINYFEKINTCINTPKHIILVWGILRISNVNNENYSVNYEKMAYKAPTWPVSKFWLQKMDKLMDVDSVK